MICNNIWRNFDDGRIIVLMFAMLKVEWGKMFSNEKNIECD